MDALPSFFRSLRQERVPDFGEAVEWVNSEPISLVWLRGKIVLLFFWDYG